VATADTEIVQQAYEAWNRADWDGVFEIFDAQVEISPPASWPEAGSVKGRNEVRRAFAAAVETMESLPSIEIEELVERGDRVLAHVRTGGTGRGSGVSLEVSFSQVFTLREEKIARIEFFLDRVAAEQAAETAAD
jgi:ketosteroid isomerase-like protein